MLLNIVLWLILGGIAGWLASIVMGRDAQMGAVANIIVGIVGALVGGLLMNLLGAPGTTGFNLYSLIVAFLGAVVLLFLFGLIQRAT
ncbi:MAG: GlsB/YeaQ/YmgE family stress response membrane protein [Chloroflexi bacterium]|nr:GlsB/YeaQ/YmgE family stress response membrane protein [Chloroflexota bacterium]MCI0576617.1 GlsB/YeaQ/YmgE family stress response membrane protein [Chloroflexota bacterium]MCI0647015.1 GlsB/YeaQ/YmgE family stress response membrane protein [Chloroflexota bacterium]MCI0730715.1 GlsB/YeaQ/YmgE family stress response membrane protein [Chloroflexota bacterium]